MRAAPVALLVLAALAGPAVADDPAAESESAREKGSLGVGLIFGEPTGISAKLYLKDDQAIQAAAGFAFVGGGIHVHADYVFHPYILQSKPSFVLPFYFGPGVRVIDYRNGRDNDYVALGLRVVAGLLFDFKNGVPLDAFVEAAGVLEYGFDSHGGAIRLNVGAGVRYYF